MHAYAIRGGKEGKERLNLLARVMLPTTLQLLNAVGINKGMRCLDVGCGGGHVTLLMARLVGPEGQVVGTDMDGEVIALAREDGRTAKLDNVEFRRADARMFQTTGEYDLVYARFLLSHLSEPERCLEEMVRACKVKGAIVLEDIDFSGSFCYPTCAAYDRYTQLYQDVVNQRGGDANIGPKLPGMLREADAENVLMSVIQPTHLEGEGKLMASITMQRIADAVISERLATESEVRQLINELNDAAKDSETVMSLPKVFQVWGRRV
jgi:ubiquinone/menaquinone biosynthesis C-methylase UbiE